MRSGILSLVLKGRLYIFGKIRTVMASLNHQLVADSENEKEKAANSPMASCLARSQNNKFLSVVTLALDHKCLRSKSSRCNAWKPTQHAEASKKVRILQRLPVMLIDCNHDQDQFCAEDEAWEAGRSLHNLPPKTS